MIVEMEHDFVSVFEVLLTLKPPAEVYLYSFERQAFRHCFGKIQPLAQACLLLLLLLSAGMHRGLTIVP